MKNLNRRIFLRNAGIYGTSIGLFGFSACANSSERKVASNYKGLIKATGEKLKDFKISLAQWSLHKAHFDGKMTALDFAKVARNSFGLDAIEYVNQFFKDKASDKKYITELKKIAKEEGVESLLIMIDGEGKLGAQDSKERTQAVENHFKWIEAAKALGCHSIRVNAAGDGDAASVASSAIEGLGALATFAKDYNINVIVENHGGYSSNGKWLSDVMAKINMPNCGTLPDFGNFCMKYDDAKLFKDRKCLDAYDRYQGVKELMPFAKAVSAKSYDFDKNGDVIETDFYKMMDIVLAAGYNGYVGIEYEGSNLSEEEGIQKTIDLLKKIKG